MENALRNRLSRYVEDPFDASIVFGSIKKATNRRLVDFQKRSVLGLGQSSVVHFVHELKGKVNILPNQIFPILP